MKTKFKRIGRQSVSVILAVMMMVSTMLVGMVTSNAAYSAHFYVVGAPVNNSDWTQKSELINNSYGEDSVYYIDIDLTQNTYFALHNGSTQYGPNTDGEEIGLNSTKSSNTYKSSAWKYTGETGKKRIVVNQSSNEWYPSIRIEEIPDITNHNVTVTFSNATVTLDGSSVTSGNAVSVTNADTHTLTVTPASGYSLTSVKNGSTELGTSGEYTLAAGSDDVNITVTTAKNATPGDWKIRQKFTGNWSDSRSDIAFTSVSGSVISVDYTFTSTANDVEFLIYTGSSWYKTSSSSALTESNNSVTLSTSNSDNVKLNVTKTGTYTFNFDTDSKKLTVIYPTVTYKNVNVTSSNATVNIDGTDIASGSYAQVAENTDFTLKVTPATGYYITSITVDGESKTITDEKGENTYSVPMGTADIAVNVQTAQIVKPTVSLTAGANEVYFGKSVTLAPGYTKTPNDDTVTANESFSVSPNTATVTDNTFTVPKSLGESNTSIAYTVTYTVTLSNGESDSASVEITAKDSEEQTAYKTLKSDIDNRTYPNPDTLTGKTAATVAAYKNAYEAAQNAVKAGYPEAKGTANTNALSALDDARRALADKTSLPQPELAVYGGNTSVVAGSSIELYISNESSYDDAANVTFEIYNENNTITPVATISKGQKANIMSVAVGANKYYAKAVLGNTDDYSLATAQSATITVTGVEMVTVIVTKADTNGTAYISKYYDVNGDEKTSTSLTSVAVKKGTDVTFKASPNSGFKIASWDGDTSKTDTTYTKTNVTADTTVTVAFAEKPKVEYSLGGKLTSMNGIDTSTSTISSYDESYKFTDNTITFVSGDGSRNYFYVFDNAGNVYSYYYNNEFTYGDVSGGSTFTLKKTTKVQTGNAYINGSKSGTTWILHITPSEDGETLTAFVEKPWEIYGDLTYFNDWDGTKYPITSSYKGNVNQYYYPLEMTAGDIAHFGFYYINRGSSSATQHRPGSVNSTPIDKALPTAEETKMYADTYNNNTTGAFTVTADTAGTYYICIDTSNSRIWYEKEATEPVPVSLTVNSSVEGGNAYIYSYTNNDTGIVVTNPGVTTVNAKPNTDVVFKAKAVEGYYVKWLTSLNSTITTGEEFTLSKVTGTVPITVSATYEQIVNYNVTVKAQDGGSVTAILGSTEPDVSAPIPVASNEVITLKAIPDLSNNYVFKGWKVNSTNYILSGGTTINNAEIKVTPLANVTFTAMFEIQQGTPDTKYQLMLSSSDSGIPQDSSGSTIVKNLTFYKTTDENDVATYSVTVPTATFSSTGSNYFAFSTTGKNTGIPQYGTAPTFTVDASTASLIKEKRVQSWGGYNFPHFKFTDASTVLSVKITYTPDTHTYTLSAVAEAPLEDAVDVYVTNGNLVGMKYGSTKITSGITENYLKEESHTSYIKYRAKLGDKVTVECTMDDAKAKLGYYVYAFVVNGAKVDVVQNGNVYQTAAPLTLTETKTEITPVYYNTNIEKNGDYVTLYVKAPSDLEPKWGNSIAIYSWYKNDGANMDGDYPGQLMMRDTQGKYIAKISKYAYAEDSNGKFVRQNTQNIAGITINNYHENQGDVHDKFLNTTQQKNRQSYDYNDFVKIAQMGYDTVEFDVKYYDSAETGTNQSKFMSNNKTLGTAPSGSKLTFAETYNATPYENLTNIDGELVSILGYDDATIRIKQLADHQEVTGLDKNKKLHIISVGNQNNIPNGGTAKWATCWYVYDSDGKYITCGMPSDFIPSGSINAEGKFEEAPLESQSKAYQKIVEKSLQYNSALISYEAEQDATSTNAAYTSTGIRCDGRWYYARSADSVAVDLGIIYKTDEEATVWTVDRPTEDSAITGTITGGTASFSYTDTIGNTHTNLASDSVERNTVLSINATNGTKYKFTGWAVPAYDADGNLTGYTPLGLTDYNATYTVATATKIYAMYEPYASGQLTLTHSKYVGADAHNGLGLFTIEAYHSDAAGNPTDSSYVSPASVSDSVTLDIENKDGAYVTVVLTTQSYAKSHFLNFYYPVVSKGTTTLNKNPNIEDYYDKECTATKRFTVKVSDLFVDDTQAIMALNYYSDLKLPEVASNITFNYNPYKEAPNPAPAPDMNGSGTTKFALTITKDSDGTVVYKTTTDAASLTLKGNTDLKDILADLTNNSEYTVTITLKPEAGSHCNLGETYRQNVDSEGNYTYINATSDTGSDIWTYDSTAKTYSANLKDLFNTDKQEFNSNTINFYTNFTAEEFNYNVTFKYLGYESRDYYDKNGYTQSPIINPDSNWWKTYTVTGKFYGAEIDTYVNTETNTFKDAFLLKVAPYEDNFVQTIKWQLGENVTYTTQTATNIEATVTATYDNGNVTVTAVLPEGPSQLYTVNYGSLVTRKNLINGATDSDDYLIVAPATNSNGDKFSYWTIEKVLDDGTTIEVAKCYNKEFNYLAYDNYTVTACYGKTDVDNEKQKVSATMTFLEYSRNQYDTGKDKVYADFAVSYNYNGKMLCANQNNNVICGVAFVVNSNYSSPSDAKESFTVTEADLLAKIKELNNGSTTDKALSDGSKVYNYKIDKTKLDNKNRLEYSWNVNNTDNNNNLTILAYSYIYNNETNEYSVSAPQSFKFYNVGHKTYENK